MIFPSHLRMSVLVTKFFYLCTLLDSFSPLNPWCVSVLLKALWSKPLPSCLTLCQQYSDNPISATLLPCVWRTNLIASSSIHLPMFKDVSLLQQYSEFIYLVQKEDIHSNIIKTITVNTLTEKENPDVIMMWCLHSILSPLSFHLGYTWPGTPHDSGRLEQGGCCHRRMVAGSIPPHVDHLDMFYKNESMDDVISTDQFSGQEVQYRHQL